MSFSAILKQLSAELNQIHALSKKEKQYRKYGYFSFGIMILFIAGYSLFYGMIDSLNDDALSRILIVWMYIPFIVGTFFMLSAARSKRKRKNISAYTVKEILNAIQSGLNYSKHQFLSKTHFEESGIFVSGIVHSSKKSCYSGEDHISGTHHSVFFEASELFYSHGRMNVFFYLFPPYAYSVLLRTQIIRPLFKKTVYDFRGLFFVADFHKKFKGKTVVIPDFLEKKIGHPAKKVQEMNFKRDELVYLENPEFEKAFAVYSDDQITARYILSHSFMEKILVLKKKIKNNIYLSFKDSKVYVAVTASDDLFDFSYKKNQTVEQQAEKVINDLKFCLGLIDDLQLNERIWR